MVFAWHKQCHFLVVVRAAQSVFDEGSSHATIFVTKLKVMLEANDRLISISRKIKYTPRTTRFHRSSSNQRFRRTQLLRWELRNFLQLNWFGLPAWTEPSSNTPLHLLSLRSCGNPEP